MLEANQWGDLERISEEFTPITLKTEENTYWKDYEYGWPIQKLRTWIEVEWSTWWNIALWSFTITWTWNISVTWVWFKPKAVRFDVCDQSTSAWTWVMTTTSQYAINFALWTQITTQCIYYGSWIKARAVYVSMDNDWFTINCTFFAATTYVNFTAFW